MMVIYGIRPLYIKLVAMNGCSQVKVIGTIKSHLGVKEYLREYLRVVDKQSKNV